VVTSDAAPIERPSPLVRNGMPQSIMNAVPAKGVVKCVQNPRRVPGWASASRRVTRRSACEVTTRIAPVSVFTETSSVSSGGRLRIRAKTRTVNRTPSPARLPNVTDHVVECSSSGRGRSATSCPSWPTMPVS
jgi:hypothetical protein